MMILFLKEEEKNLNIHFEKILVKDMEQWNIIYEKERNVIYLRKMLEDNMHIYVVQTLFDL